MLGIVLLIVGGVGLVLTLLSVLGVDAGGVDIHLGDSGAGLLSIVTPFATGFGLIAGGLLTFTGTETWIALLTGALAGIILSIAAVVVLGYLVDAEEELPSFDLIGSSVRIVEPVTPGRYGLGEVRTSLGTRQITVTADEALDHNDEAVVVEKIGDNESFLVARVSLTD
ncbi:hypothetical protein [Gordonia neofelifaecis]|uniref:NfeD-like C-terminal domain-containing protein n=1 Tax=Gordonia neofelifaecis NRRL B-59395 TaxID=644548 RepID=F1YP13_9ACTN|nr:hypothetical protein [Gordonia neofelifaecis]EGD53518.1 hypothetical protein SCNU_18377 [Gordonia neofelifaecis NRRL B-59395]